MKERPLICSAREVRGLLNGSVSLIVRPVVPQPHCPKDVDAIRARLRGEIVFGAPSMPVPGDRLWVRETWWANRHSPVGYRADGEMPAHMAGCSWRPSIHMPKRFARIWLEVVKVRIQRLHSSTNEEAIAAGVDVDQCDLDGVEYIDGFAELWDSVYRKRFPWESNPWVWVAGVRRASA